MREPLNVLDYLTSGENYLMVELPHDADSFKQLSAAYIIPEDCPPFSKQFVSSREICTLVGDITFVEDWMHIPSNRIMHVAYKPYDDEWDEPTIFFGTKSHFVFALEGDVVIPSPKEQWDSVDRSKPFWWHRALYNDEYTDFFMYGLYKLPMHYTLLSRNDYENRRGMSGKQIIDELTSLGYEYVGEIKHSHDNEEFVSA